MGQLLPLGGQLQDYFLIGMKTDDRLFERTDMFLWYGIRGQAEKLSANLSTLRAHRVSLCRKGTRRLCVRAPAAISGRSDDSTPEKPNKTESMNCIKTE